MSADEHQLIKSVARVTPVLEEDWLSKAGTLWRSTMQGISDFNKKYLKLDEKAAATPDLVWRAAEGYASERHARAMADYSKAENDRIDAELRRRTLISKVRQEEAEASKREAEARIARITEIKARLELCDQLRKIGVTIDVVSEDLSVRKLPADAPDMSAEIVDREELSLIVPVESISIQQTS
jgi:hypothetical protein